MGCIESNTCQAGELCYLNQHCVGSLVCNNGKCGISCTQSNTCQQGQFCYLDQHCARPFKCSNNKCEISSDWIGHTCTALGKEFSGNDAGEKTTPLTLKCRDYRWKAWNQDGEFCYESWCWYCAECKNNICEPRNTLRCGN